MRGAGVSAAYVFCVALFRIEWGVRGVAWCVVVTAIDTARRDGLVMPLLVITAERAQEVRCFSLTGTIPRREHMLLPGSQIETGVTPQIMLAGLGVSNQVTR